MELQEGYTIVENVLQNVGNKENVYTEHIQIYNIYKMYYKIYKMYYKIYKIYNNLQNIQDGQPASQHILDIFLG